MTKKKKREAAPGFGAVRRYYDPGAHAKPRRPVGRGLTPEQTLNALPVGMTRTDRRRRAKMTFEEQRQLAASCGFTTPDPRDVAGLAGEERGAFVALWEAAYARSR